jgi:hypothetical protein
MNRSLALFAFITLVQLASAQWPWAFPDSVMDRYRTHTNWISLEGTWDYNSNVLTNEFVWSLRQGEYLDRALREEVAAGLKGNDRAGNVLTGRLAWTGMPGLLGHANWRPLVSVAHHDQVGVRFTDDLFRVTFFGNAAYEDRTAELAPSAHERIRYHTIGLGITGQGWKRYLRLDAVLGRELERSTLDHASVYTGIDGTVIRADLEGLFQRSDTAAGAPQQINGAGIALSGAWSLPVQVASWPIQLALSVEDMGFIAWNANALTMRKDTLIAFEGIAVENLFDLSDVLVGEEQLLDTFGLRYERGPFTTMLPFRVAFELMATPWADVQLGLAVDQRNLPGYIPLIAAVAYWRACRSVQLGTNLGYGGFGGYRVGLSGRFAFGQHVQLVLATPHVPGLFMGSNKGLGATFGFCYGF